MVRIPDLAVWWRSRWLGDLAVVAVVAGVTAADAWWNEPGTRQADPLTYLLVAVSVAALLWRRRWPVAVAVVCGAALTGWYLLGYRGELLNAASMVALYTVAVQGDRRRTVLVGLVAVGWSGSLGLVTADPLSAPVAELLWPAAALLLGEVVRGRRELARAYAARLARAAADRERQAQHRVQLERLRIAREFHDVVAHTMAGVNVQMGVAVAAFDQRPEAARVALQQARTSCRDALRELRATVAVLRGAAPDGAVGAAGRPAPGLGQLDELVRQANGAGVNVSLHRQTGGCEMPAGVELAVYRIVQEALTNVIRHAHAGAAAVSVTSDGEAVVVEVVDDGTGSDGYHLPDGAAGRPAATAANRHGGYGLSGMAERATALGGRVDHGPAPGGGFQVRAVLPVGQAQPMGGEQP